mmetsp:Transcript_22024/g.62609  ORF Transcript_22024/g.62609 Transcript_22024/m.62609 type:complete len:255 (+) Transcript_22024:1093-1857(+)
MSPARQPSVTILYAPPAFVERTKPSFASPAATTSTAGSPSSSTCRLRTTRQSNPGLHCHSSSSSPASGPSRRTSESGTLMFTNSTASVSDPRGPRAGNSPSPRVSACSNTTIEWSLDTAAATQPSLPRSALDSSRLTRTENSRCGAGPSEMRVAELATASHNASAPSSASGAAPKKRLRLKSSVSSGARVALTARASIPAHVSLKSLALKLSSRSVLLSVSARQIQWHPLEPMAFIFRTSRSSRFRAADGCDGR